MTPSIPSQAITDFLAIHLSLAPDQYSLSDPQAEHFFQSYTIQTEQETYVLRVAYPDAVLSYEVGALQREAKIQALISTQTDILAPELIAVDFEHHLIDRDLLLTRTLPGTSFSQITTLTHAQHDRIYRRLGDYLRQIHSLSGVRFGYVLPDQPGNTELTWQQAFKAMWHALIDDIVALAVYTDQDATLMKTVFDDHAGYFDYQSQPVLLYLGAREENIKVDPEGNITEVTGFHQTVWGDPEMDFAVLDYAGIWAASVWEGYGQARPDSEESRVRRKFYLLYEIQKQIPPTYKRCGDLQQAEQFKQTALLIAGNIGNPGT